MKYKRDKYGKYAQDRTLYKWFLYLAIFGVVLILTSVGVRRLSEAAAKALVWQLEVKNVQAVETVVNDSVTPAAAPHSKPVLVVSDKHLSERIDYYATKYNTSAYQMARTLWCETKFRNVQSSVIQKNGMREDSWGIAQIHLPDHPTITKAQALDIDFSLDFMARYFAAGKDYMWHAYNKRTDTCNV